MAIPAARPRRGPSPDFQTRLSAPEGRARRRRSRLEALRGRTHAMSLQPHSIFISYRRLDSVYAVDQLDKRLKLAFGADAVFRDASSIVLGAVFPERIRRALDVARVALVVVGPGWLRATMDPSDIHSPRRLDDPVDWVRIEIGRASCRERV